MQTPLELNHVYLLKYLEIILSAKILVITEKAYYIVWNHNSNPRYEWLLKHVINTDWEVVEDISKFMNVLPSPVKETGDSINAMANYQHRNILCENCGGNGMIADDKVSSGFKLCPKCFGGKYVREIVLNV
jgi:formylmethanofuran dehydrogenase subunit E